jgi:dUTP pyrophosphatase
MRLRIDKRSQTQLTRGTKLSAGLDLRSNEDYDIEPGEIHVFSTEFYAQIEAGWFGLVRPRSGLASKHGLILSTSGVIDADYRDEWRVPMINLGKYLIPIKKGERIAQVVFLPVPPLEVEFADELDLSERSGGWGSTGKF